ncbi:hypothetical protein ACSFCW_16970 [Yokenella regensburgei]|uniref:hypothetical protein n=1 Tax=Yokenella regensburgei TaxID=158877 RepID=UPI003ED9CBAE
MDESRCMTVLVQYLGHVIHAGGSVTYRTVEIDLTYDQVKALELKADEEYGPVIFRTAGIKVKE